MHSFCLRTNYLTYYFCIEKLGPENMESKFFSQKEMKISYKKSCCVCVFVCLSVCGFAKERKMYIKKYKRNTE